MHKDFVFSILFSFLIITLIDSMSQIKEPIIQASDVSRDHESVDLEYGLPVDSFIVEENTIMAGTSLSSLIGQFNLTPETTQTIIEKAAKVFDIKKIKKGNTYKVFLSKDSLKTVDYFIYEHNATDYILFDLKDTVHIEKRQKEIEYETHTASGTVETSLWNAIFEKGGDPLLAMKLSEIYAWSIDFFGLQKGDQFKVYYEEQIVEGKSAGINKIHAAWFKHMGKEYYAIPFYQDSAIHFFDEDGNNLKKAFLKAPLNYSRIASGYSNSRLHPILKIRRPHHGVDYSAPSGTPVQSIGDGIIIHVGYSGGAGNYVKIRHNGTYTTGYMHLSRYGKGIRQGKHVSQGEIIGYVGSTGLSTGPHLDFRVWKNDQPFNPLKLEAPPAKPVENERLEFFTKIKDIWRSELDKVIIPEAIENQVIAEKSKALMD